MDGIVRPLRTRTPDRCRSRLACRVLLLLIFISGPGAVRARAGSGDAIGAQAELGLRAPGCELASLARTGEFEELRLRSFAGRTVLIDFWASWCPTCEHAFPFLNELARAYRGRGFEVIGVNLDTNPRDAVAFLAAHPVEFEVAHDPTGRCPRAFGLVGMPSAYLIDAGGRVRAVTRGFRAGEAQGLRSQIESLLVKKADGTLDPALARRAEPSPP